MKLVGLLDSPYVRRAAVALHLLGLPFEHQFLSVFRDYQTLHTINPVVKAPTLVLDDGSILMDSTLIIEYAEHLAGRRLRPSDPVLGLRDLRLTGLALAACEKTVQMVYETKMRPLDKQHQPWLDRVREQLQSAYRELEMALDLIGPGVVLTQTGPFSTAIAWRFTHYMMPGQISLTTHRRLTELSEQAEQLPAFQLTPLE